jgi:hypothetical protein
VLIRIKLAAEDAAPPENPLAGRQQIFYLLPLLCGQLALQSRIGSRTNLGPPLVQGPHVLFVPRVGERSLQLDQQRLEADPQLQRRLAVAAGVDVGAGSQQQGLADVSLFAAAEDRGHPFLGSQLFLTAPSARRAWGDLHLAGVAKTAHRGFLAASVAEEDPLGCLGR